MPLQQFNVATPTAASVLTQEQRQAANASFDDLGRRVSELEHRMGTAEGVVTSYHQEDTAKFASLLGQASSTQQEFVKHQGEMAARMASTDQSVMNKVGQIETQILRLSAELQQVRNNTSGGQGSGNSSSGF